MSRQDDDNSVTITTNPDSTPYEVGQNLTLTCMVDPSVPADASAAYSWNCSSCFANGRMTPTISQTLTAMDMSP